MCRPVVVVVVVGGDPAASLRPGPGRPARTWTTVSKPMHLSMKGKLFWMLLGTATTLSFSLRRTAPSWISCALVKWAGESAGESAAPPPSVRACVRACVCVRAYVLPYECLIVEQIDNVCLIDKQID